jgi:hypothetical protein
MHMRHCLLLAALIATPALAADPLRDLCSERPGLDTPACTVDSGHLQLEVGIGDWTLDKQPDSRTDTIEAGQGLLRYGVGDSTELRLGWTAYGHVRMRDRATGDVERQSGVGDITVGMKQNLSHPDGQGLSITVLPYASLPVGGHAIGAGDWGAGLLVPVDYQLSDSLTLEATPELDAAVDEDRHGRHLAYGSAAGVQAKLSKVVSISAEAQVIRDRDQEEHSTQALAGLYLAVQPGEQTQLDLGSQIGLNRASPDVELYVGMTERF